MSATISPNNQIDEVQSLKDNAAKMQSLHLTQLFSQNTQRFEQLSVQFDCLTFDYSKHRVDLNIIDQLTQFAKQKNLNNWIERLFSTEEINYTENRAAMH